MNEQLQEATKKQAENVAKQKEYRDKIKPEIEVEEPKPVTITPDVKIKEPKTQTIVPDIKIQDPKTTTIVPEVKVQEPKALMVEPNIKVEEPKAITIHPKVKVESSEAEISIKNKISEAEQKLAELQAAQNKAFDEFKTATEKAIKTINDPKATKADKKKAEEEATDAS